MTRRPAVTLMEVLIAMFIMAIGMMALLALFPVGAVSMAQALKDDRCAYASLMAENVAIATNVRYGDANVQTALNASPSGLVYVDPYGVSLGNLGALGTNPGIPNPGIPRVSPLFVGSKTPSVPGSPPLIDRWFSLPDDITFNQSGTPDTSNTGGIIDRGRRYSWAYLLRRQPSVTSPLQSPMYAVQLFAVVYSGRPVNSLTLETTLPATGAVGTNSIVINAIGTTIKRGGWILDSTTQNVVNGNGIGNFNFYRVTNLAEFNGTTTIELQQNLSGPLPTSQITIMDYVAEVFDKGTGWQQ